ncbi:hypothetical protein FisN_1Lh085 [Fistulifera solaris]|uniref:6-pyruvoyltetrahydropterin synthase n=1 Tax=Fistulifera solaris TaxID=1519565 RepID=A0A1Z5K4V3_FISSO|nr:hypothetical protein FisN_1Lh085 [Fistulifera solaris]|eukprot:GAX21256.1 hypothetical protein FisN_1Lh085 [Fistulifera solaris]
MHPEALTSNFEVYVSKDTFKFNAAHFVAFQGYRERLHGHNYQVGVRLLGRRTLGADGYVIDFGNIKAVCKTVCKKLNEHFLCPMYSDVLKIESDDNTNTNIRITCQDGSSFSFPPQDCAMLPIVHATTEEIAIYLWSEILKGLNSQYLVQRGIHTMEVTVAEAPGQQATFRWEIPQQVMEENFSLDVRTFLQTGQVVPMPCLEQDKQNKSTCCDGCQNHFATQLERLAKAINQRTTTEAMTPDELQNMLNHSLS